MKTKRMILGVIVVCVCFSCIMPVQIGGVNSIGLEIGVVDVTDELIILKAVDVIEKIYKNKDINTEYDLSTNIDDDIMVYLNDKIYMHQYVSDLYDRTRTNYSVEAILKLKESTETHLKLKFQVITTCRYSNNTNISVNSEVVEVLYDRSLNMFTDIFAPLNYYDIATRNTEAEYSRGFTKKDMNAFVLTSEIIYKQGELLNDVNEVYEIETAPLNSVINSIASENADTLNDDDIVSYALENCYKDQPSSGDSSVVDYYDFSEIEGNYDCTNFVSHALVAGGANINDPGGAGISNSGWYYRNLNNRSSSWSGVPYLHDYIINNTVSGTLAGTSNMYSLNDSYWKVGSILQLKYAGLTVYRHSMIITDKEYSNDGQRAYAYATARTSDEAYQINEAAETLVPGGSKRTINVYNY